MGNRTTPSVITFAELGEHLVGLPAKRQLVFNAGSTVFALKRLIHGMHKDKELQDDAKHWLVFFLTCVSQVADARPGRSRLSPSLTAGQQ